MRADFPGSIDPRVKFLDRYTLGDILRVGALIVVGWYLADGSGAAVGLVCGLLFAEFKIKGNTVDSYVLQGLSWLSMSPTVSSPKLTKLVDDAAILDDETVLGAIKVSSPSLEYADEYEKKASHGTLKELLDEVRFPLEIHSRQRHVDLSEVSGTSGSAVTTDHYVLVKSSGTSLKQGYRQTRNRCERIESLLTAADLYAEQLTGEQLKTGVEQFYFGETSISRNRFETEYGQKRVRRMLYIDEYPRQLPLEWLTEVLNAESSGLIDVVQVANPVSDGQRDRMDRMLARLKTEIDSSRKPSRQASLRQQRQDLEDLIEVEARNDTLVNYGVYIVAKGDTPDEAQKTRESVESVLKRFRVETGEPANMNQAVKAISPLHTSRFNETEIVPAYSAATGFSFSSATVEPDSVLFGERGNGSPVILDRFNWDAGHTSVMGKTGSGKTYWTKLNILRSVRFYDDLEVYIIDPKKRDYQCLVDELDGETLFVDNLAETVSDVVRYTVRDPSGDNTEGLAEAVERVYRKSVETNEKTLVVVDEAHRILTKGDSVYQEGVQAVSRLVRETRDRNVAATLVTQNADEFTRSNEGKNILRNIDCNLFFNQKDVSSEIARFFKLSEKEERTLLKLRTGKKVGFSEALLHGTENTRIKIEAPNREHQLIEEQDEKEVLSNQAVAGTPDKAGKTDGGQKIERRKDTDSSENGLFDELGMVLRSRVRLFEYLLLIVFSAAAFLYWNGTLRPRFHSIQTFLNPGLADFLAVSTLGLIGVEIVWIVFLSIDSWLKHSGG